MLFEADLNFFAWLWSINNLRNQVSENKACSYNDAVNQHFCQAPKIMENVEAIELQDLKQR